MCLTKPSSASDYILRKGLLVIRIKFTIYFGERWVSPVNIFYALNVWCRGVVVIINLLHNSFSKIELRFCAGLNPAHGVLEIRYGEDL